jgi:hypothetical protein
MKIQHLLCQRCMKGVQMLSKELNLKQFQATTKELLEKDILVFATHVCLTPPHPVQSLENKHFYSRDEQRALEEVYLCLCCALQHRKNCP